MSENFDTLTNVAADLEGEILEVEALDDDLDPNRVLPIDLEWAVRVRWQIKGLCAPGLGGTWRIRAMLESMGEGFEGTVADVNVPVNKVAPDLEMNYDETINIDPPNSFGDNFIPGTYKLVIVITHSNTGGGVTKITRMAGFYEGRLLEFTESEV